MDNEFRSDTGKTAGKTREKVREKAAEVAGKAKEKVEGRYDEQKTRTMSEVSHLASALRRAGDDLQSDGISGLGSTLLGRVAGHLETLGTTMDGKSLDDIVSDVERLARRNPAMFIGGAMLIGFAASRFLKSSSANRGYGYGYDAERGIEFGGPGDYRNDFFDRGSDMSGGSGSGTASGMEPTTGGIGTTGGIRDTGGSTGIGTTGTSGTGASGFETTGNIRSGRTSGGNSSSGGGSGSSGNVGGL